MSEEIQLSSSVMGENLVGEEGGGGGGGRSIKEEKEEENEMDMMEPISAWDELDIDPNIIRSIYNYGFERPSPIQAKAIRPFVHKRDMIIQAQSGTGKTGTFVIGALTMLQKYLEEEEEKKKQAAAAASSSSSSSRTVRNFSAKTTGPYILILAPTGELVQQSAMVMEKLSQFMEPSVIVKTLVGGTSVTSDLEYFKSNSPHVVIGCPGRVFDLMNRHKQSNGIAGMSSKNLRLLILDEADALLNATLILQIQDIFSFLSLDIQTVLVSASFKEEIRQIMTRFMRPPVVEILVKQEQLTLEGIKQYVLAIEDDRMKYDTLKDLYANIMVSQCIIFCNSVKRVDFLSQCLTEDGFSVSSLHGRMEKVQRDQALTDFRTGVSRILISSDVTARGIDVQQVGIVINFDIPNCESTYLHRIGRSGRWGRKGIAINFATRNDVNQLRNIETFYQTEIQDFPAVFPTI